MDTVTGRLHLLPAHSRHLKAAPRCLHTLASFKTVWQISEVLLLCRDRENNDIAIDLHKSFRRFELFRVFLNQFRGQGRKIFLTKSNHQECSCYDIINFAIFIPQSTVQIKPYELSFIIADQRHRVRIGISCANVSADLRLQGMKVGVDLLHIGFLHRFHYKHSHLFRGSPLRSAQHFIRMGLLRVLQSCLDLRRIKIKKFLIARGILELFDLRGKIVLLRLSQRRQLFIQSGNASGHQAFVNFFLCGVCLRVLRRILRIVLTEKLIHVKGDIHSPLGFFFFGKIILEGHHPVFVGDTAALTVVILMETVTRITHIALIREGAVFLQRNVPAVGLIVDVILQMLWHLHNVQFFDVIAAQIVIVMDIGINLIAIQILGEVDDLLQAAAMVAHFHTGLKLCVFAFAHFIQLRCQIIQLVQILIFTQLTVKTVHIAVIVRDEPFLIGLAEVILLADPDPLKHFFQFLGGGGKLHPLAHKLALIVLPKIGDKGGKGIILVVIVIWHISTSLQLRRRLFLVGLHLVFLCTFLLALFQPFPDGGLFLRLRRAFMVPLVTGERNISVFRKMPLFLLHGILAKRNRVDCLQKFRGQQHIHVLCQIPPPQIIQIVDVRLKYEIVDVVRKLLELLRRCQFEGRCLHRRQQLPVLRGEGSHRRPHFG